MSIGAIIFLAVQASAPAGADAASHGVAVRATATVEILAPATIAFDDLDSILEERPAAVQLREDSQGITWLEFS